nr:MAG TPA: hypothetical protein [Caudoviricetes sp.]DAM07288.1 MAG TPA: hypothetical protein [Caudoviricetes sp.]
MSHSRIQFPPSSECNVSTHTHYMFPYDTCQRHLVTNRHQPTLFF